MPDEYNSQILNIIEERFEVLDQVHKHQNKEKYYMYA